MVFTNQEKAEAIADSLEKQFQLNELSPPLTEALVQRRLNKFFKRHPTDKIEPCKPSEIVRIIGKLKKGKCPAIDGFTNLMLQRLPVGACIAKICVTVTPTPVWRLFCKNVCFLSDWLLPFVRVGRMSPFGSIILNKLLKNMEFV
ncbi:hypothetical protein AVEN_219168-1 [Araneus ventricosus]|uniref:Uncharacterized protein n=1 Tax=Araneus ventricosus TaxID=182803 RepID=A0A4Y2FQI1_ARAVE|nr:hypothetical protein AVEN_219168-1 [Araneus ventricosus]